MNDLPPEVAKTLLYLDAWFDDVDELIAHGREAFIGEPLLQHAADSLLSKIGEASVRLRKAGWTLNRPDIPWSQVISNRNLIVHGYDVISRDREWTTLVVSVRALRDSLAADIAHAKQQIENSPGGPPSDGEPTWLGPPADE